MKSTIQSKNNSRKKYNKEHKIDRLPNFFCTSKTVNSSQRTSPYASFRMSCKGNSMLTKSQSTQNICTNYKKNSQVNNMYQSLKKKQKQFQQFRQVHPRYKNYDNAQSNFISSTHTPKNYQTQADEQPITVNRSNFKFMYQIGFGGFGKVWKVQQKNSWQYYAMKQIHKRKVIEKDSVECILNQRKVLSTLKHDFLVNIKWAFQDKTCLYLIMDYLKGADLRYHICYRQIFSEVQTKFILACLILAIQEIHSKGIVHRDIKPENLVLEETGYVRLTDFGIAKYVRDIKNGKYDSSGTPGYMAPEVLFKQPYDQVADFFAVGVIGYELMLNKRPYFGKNRKEIKQKIQQQQISISQKQLPSDWSEYAADFINKLLLINPNQRLGSQQGVKQLKQHPWMGNINWKKLHKKQLIPPFIPNIICETKDYLQEIQSYNQMNNQQNNSKNQLALTTEENKLFQGYQLSIMSPYSTPFRNIRNTLERSMFDRDRQRQRQRQRVSNVNTNEHHLHPHTNSTSNINTHINNSNNIANTKFPNHNNHNINNKSKKMLRLA